MNRILAILGFAILSFGVHAQGVATNQPGVSAPFNAGSPITVPATSIQTTAGAAFAARALLSVKDRAPGQLDGLPAGYSVGDLWNQDGIIYQNIQNVASHAAWSFLNNTSRGLALDIVPTAVAAYGLDQLNSAYVANKAIDVVIGGTPTTIGFVNGKFDGGTADKLLAGAVSAPISKFYDQSGNAADAPQATTANQPLLMFTSTMGWAVVFNSTQTTGNTYKYFAATLAAGVTPGNSSFASVVQTKSSIQGNTLWTLNGASWPVYTSVLVTPGLGVGGATSGAVTPTGPVVLTGNAVSSTLQLAAGNNLGTATTGAGGGAQTALTIGSDGSVTFGPADMFMRSLIVYGRTMAAGEMATLRALLSAQNGLVPQALPNIVLNVGDSITFGLGSTTDQGWVQQFIPMLKRPAAVYNFGISGITAAGYPTGVFAKIAAIPHASVVANVLLGTNDIGGGASAATAYASIQSVITALRTAIPGVRVNVSTLTPRTGAPASLAALNVLIYAGWPTFADGLIDYAGDPTLSTSAGNTAIYVDGLHPTTLGNAYMAPIAAAGTNALMP